MVDGKCSKDFPKDYENDTRENGFSTGIPKTEIPKTEIPKTETPKT
jgi:hypothetical protein